MKPNSSKVSPGKLIALSVLILVALIVPTSIVYLQHRLQARPLMAPRPWDDPKIAQSLSDGRLAKAKAIRAEWQPWALQHKALLSAMLSSQGKNFSTIQAAYPVSPPLAIRDWRPDTQSGPVKFGWLSDYAKVEAHTGPIKWANAESKQQFETNKWRTAKWLKDGYSAESDYQIAVSINAGPTTTQVWASGRITETSWVDNPNARKGEPMFVITHYKERVPPFDFLTSTNAN